MSGLNSFETILGQLIQKKLTDMINELCLQLGDGDSRRGSDVAATAISYCEQVSYIRALRDAQNICKDVEQELIRSG